MRFRCHPAVSGTNDMLKALGLNMSSSAKKENGGGGTSEQEEIGDTTGREGLLNAYGCVSVCEEGPGICSLLLTIGSLLLIFASLPLSLYVVVKVVQVGIRCKDERM